MYMPILKYNQKIHNEILIHSKITSEEEIRNKFT